jgi:hypothetical protein
MAVKAGNDPGLDSMPIDRAAICTNYIGPRLFLHRACALREREQ